MLLVREKVAKKTHTMVISVGGKTVVKAMVFMVEEYFGGLGEGGGW